MCGAVQIGIQDGRYQQKGEKRWYGGGRNYGSAD